MTIKGELSNGFKYEYDDKVFHNMRFLDAVADSQKPDKAYAFSDVVKLILGEEQRDKLYDYIEAQGEDVTVELIGDMVQEITEAASTEVKNS